MRHDTRRNGDEHVRLDVGIRSGVKNRDESSAVHGSQKVSHDFGHVIPFQFAEIQYFFLDRDSNDPGEQVAYVVLFLYGPPSQEMPIESSYTLHACKYTGEKVSVAFQ
jgi:hypothetical protein